MQETFGHLKKQPLIKITNHHIITDQPTATSASKSPPRKLPPDKDVAMHDDASTTTVDNDADMQDDSSTTTVKSSDSKRSLKMKQGKSVITDTFIPVQPKTKHSKSSKKAKASHKMDETSP